MSSCFLTMRWSSQCILVFLAFLIWLFENLMLVTSFDDKGECNPSGGQNISTATEPLEFLIHKVCLNTFYPSD